MPSMLGATLFAALLPPSIDASSAACEDHDVVTLMSSAYGSGTRFRSSDKGAANSVATGDASKPLDVGWFGGGFAESESTFSEDGVSAHLDLNPEKLVMNGKDPETRVPAQLPNVRSQQFFHESPSAGGFDAWQTDYPSVDRSVVGSDGRANSNDWRSTPEGWTQDYAPTTRRDDPGPMKAGWFDASVTQYDGFGRKKVPDAGTGARLMGSGMWAERSVNTTLTCAEPGCQAASTLQAFDGATEMGSNCKLTIDVHPTDFDDDYGAEAVEFLKANGYVLTHNCNPGARGCNATAATPLYSCANDVDVDGLMNGTGALIIEGKITDRVDECPIAGNLLSGVAIVTCMVSPITTTTTTTTTPPPEFVRSIDNATAPIACNTPGCVGTAELFFEPYYAEHGGVCTLSLSVAQTDFDQNNGVIEIIEYIKVEGEDVATEVAPGKNPCVEEYESGSPVAPEDRVFAALTQVDVTAQVLSAAFRGRLQITGKISDAVDECGTSPDGNLLDGILFLECSPPADSVAPVAEADR